MGAAGDALVDEALADHDLAAGEVGRTLGAGLREHDVGARLGEQHDVVVEGRLRVDDGGQRVVVDLHQLGGVGALPRALGEHDGGTGSPTKRTVSRARNGRAMAVG